MLTCAAFIMTRYLNVSMQHSSNTKSLYMWKIPQLWHYWHVKEKIKLKEFAHKWTSRSNSSLFGRDLCFSMTITVHHVQQFANFLSPVCTVTPCFVLSSHFPFLSCYFTIRVRQQHPGNAWLNHTVRACPSASSKVSLCLVRRFVSIMRQSLERASGNPDASVVDCIGLSDVTSPTVIMS